MPPDPTFILNEICGVYHDGISIAPWGALLVVALVFTGGLVFKQVNMTIVFYAIIFALLIVSFTAFLGMLNVDMVTACGATSV